MRTSAVLLAFMAVGAGVRWAAAADADCVGQELAPDCSLLLMSTGAGQDCSPACAASVAALVQSGCWDAVVSMASSMGLGGNFDGLKAKCLASTGPSPLPSPSPSPATALPSPSPSLPIASPSPSASLPVPSPSPLPPLPSAPNSPWANYTRETQTLYIAIKMLSSTITASDEECATLCNEDLKCEFWTWCPTNVTSGCGIPAANASYSSTVPPGGCILSCDDVKDRQVLFLAYGDSVPFMAGQYDPQNTTAPPTNSSSGGALGGGGGIPGGISPSVRRLLQGGIGTMGSVWTNYTYDQNRFNQGIDSLPAITVQTAEQCAQACNADKYCEFWSLCPPSAGLSIGCEVPSFSPTGSAQTVPAGTCVLSYDGTKDQMAYLLMLGKRVTFEGGRWNGSAAATPTTPGTTPTVILPPVPGLVTTPTGPASNTSGPGPTPIPFVPPLTANSSSSNNTSNGTLPSGTTNSSSVIIYTSWVRAYGSEPAWCNNWNGTAFERREFLGNGFLAEGGNATVAQADVQAYVTQLCASRSTAGATIAADLLSDDEAAHKAFVATLSTCTASDQYALLQEFADHINPLTNTDVDEVVRYATAWSVAGEELGVATCVTIAAVDRTSGKVTEQTVHPAKVAPIS